MVDPHAAAFLVLLILGPVASAQASPPDSVGSFPWLDIAPRLSYGGRTVTYDVAGGGSTSPTGDWLFTGGGGVRVIDVSDSDPLSAVADSTGSPPVLLGLMFYANVGRRLGASPVVARVGASGWIPPVPPEGVFVAGGDLRVELALTPRGPGPTLSIGAYVTGARPSRLGLSDRGVSVSLGYQFQDRRRTAPSAAGP